MTLTQILTADQMSEAEQALFDSGTSTTQLMELAAGGAAEWVRRVAAGRSVTVLCGPGNNGGDGYVIARKLREAGNIVEVIAPIAPQTDAARKAYSAWGGDVRGSGGKAGGGVFVDCLFGNGLSRSLDAEHALLLRDCVARHAFSVAVDLPSGTASDSGDNLNERLPMFDLTLALGAWKFAHWSLPGRTRMGERRLVPIGIEPVEGAAHLITRPQIEAPLPDSQKYKRGLAAIVGGSMPGAAILSSRGAQRAGAGYVKLFAPHSHPSVTPDLVVDKTALDQALSDDRIDAILVGPGLGRDEMAKDRLATAIGAGRPMVLDADALVLLAPDMLSRDLSALMTPHDGELEALCQSFGVVAKGRRNRATALARSAGAVVLAKGPDTVIAAPDGRVAIAKSAPSWLSTAGTGDVLAGVAVSRMANGADPFTAAKEAVWLHCEAARQCGPAFTADDIAHAIRGAIARCL